MTGIKIVTDSSITIEPALVEELGITIVPLSVLVDGVLYSDTDLAEGEFLDLMRKSKTLPKTSQPPVGLFAETFSRLARDGSSIISIHLSHALSGTLEAAKQGAILSGVNVTVVDSSVTDQSMAFQVKKAAQLAKEGADKEEILAAISDIKEKTETFIGISTLENLVKGGRIGRVAGFLSSFMNIRVVLELVDDELRPVMKGRGNKTFKKWLDEWTTSVADKKIMELGISYAGEPEFANELKERLQLYVEKPITVLETGSIIQSHTGENAWAIMVHYE